MVDVGVDQLGPGLPQGLDNEADEANLGITCHLLFVISRLFLKAPVTSPHWHCLGHTWRTPPVPQPSPERRQREIIPEYCDWCNVLTRSPWAQNSSISLSTHSLYSSSGLVGLDKSEQWTMFWRTCKTQVQMMQLGRIIHSSYLNPVVEIVQHEDPIASDLLCLEHGLEVGQQLHVLAHVRGQDLEEPTNHIGARTQ